MHIYYVKFTGPCVTIATVGKQKVHWVPPVIWQHRHSLCSARIPLTLEAFSSSFPSLLELNRLRLFAPRQALIEIESRQTKGSD